MFTCHETCQKSTIIAGISNLSLVGVSDQAEKSSKQILFTGVPLILLAVMTFVIMKIWINKKYRGRISPDETSDDHYILI